MRDGRVESGLTFSSVEIDESPQLGGIRFGNSRACRHNPTNAQFFIKQGR